MTDDNGTLTLSFKKVSYITLSLIILFGIGYFISINSKLANAGTSAVGPDYFPNLLAVVLIVLCVASLIKTLRSEDREIRIPYFKLISLTAGCIIVFIAIWYFTGYFYILTFIFLSALFVIYRYERKKRNFIILTSMGMALIITALIYVVFGQLMVIRF